MLVDPVFSVWPNKNWYFWHKEVDGTVWSGLAAGRPIEKQSGRGPEASGQHHWPFGGESPCFCSGGTPLVAEPSNPVIKETKVAGGSERAHNVDPGGGVVFWSPTSTLKMNTLGVCRSLSERLESLAFVCIVSWLNVIRCHNRVWMNFTPDDRWCRWDLSFREIVWAFLGAFQACHMTCGIFSDVKVLSRFVNRWRDHLCNHHVDHSSTQCQFKHKELVEALPHLQVPNVHMFESKFRVQ